MPMKNFIGIMKVDIVSIYSDYYLFLKLQPKNFYMKLGTFWTGVNSNIFFPTDRCSSCECSTEIYFETVFFSNWLVFQLWHVPADAENRVKVTRVRVINVFISLK